MDGASPAILLLGLPPGSFCGIDLLSFTTTPKFQGIKDVPTGYHFVFAGASSTLSVRHGAWFRITEPAKGARDRQLVIKKWDAETESLVTETSEAEVLRHRANVGSLWRENLTPYRQTATKDAPSGDVEESQAWSQTSDHITAPLLSRILDSDTNKWTLTSSSSAAGDEDDVANLPSIPGGASLTVGAEVADRNLNYLPIRLRETWPATCTGRERTLHAQDRSWYLSSLLPNDATSAALSEHVIGELQFTFLTTLTLNNYSSLRQWQRLINLVLTCRSLVATHSSFFITFIAVLRSQLSYLRDDTQPGTETVAALFELDEEETSSFLIKLLIRFKTGIEHLPTSAASVESAEGVQEVLDELEDLEEYLRQEYSWRFEEAKLTIARRGMLDLEDGERVEMDVGGGEEYDEEDEAGEWAPAVVELTEEQMKMLGIEGGGVRTAGITAGVQKNGRGAVAETARIHRISDAIEQDEVENGDESEDGDNVSKLRELDEEDEEEEETMDLEDMDSRY